MKILILQLARLGDIFTTWPVLNGLRRSFPQAEIHFMVRENFSQACEGLTSIDRVIHFDTREILSPSLCDDANDAETALRLTRILTGLKSESYDQIINLSFSPFSSYLTHAIANEETKISGYTRFEDGYLSIPDDTSAYFYAQVGIDRDNRAHLADIFAAASGVVLEASDWRVERNETYLSRGRRWQNELPQEYLVLHFGASVESKTYDSHKWTNYIARLGEKWDGKIVLVGGGSAEKEIADRIEVLDRHGNVINLVGKTSVPDLFPIIERARLVVGGDSCPMHIASLTQTKCLNLSFSTVNFWETGPRTVGSRILWSESSEGLPSDEVVNETIALLNGHEAAKKVILVNDDIPSYEPKGYDVPEFSWNLIEAIYMGKNWPELETTVQYQGFQRLKEINQLALEQISLLEEKGSQADVKMIANLLNRVDEIITTIGRVSSTLGPLARWFETEKMRIGPGDLSYLVRKTKSIHDTIEDITTLYLGGEGSSEKELGA